MQSCSPANGNIVCGAAEPKHIRETQRSAEKLLNYDPSQRDTGIFEDWEIWNSTDWKWVRCHHIFKARSNNLPACLPASWKSTGAHDWGCLNPLAVWTRPAPVTSSVHRVGSLGRRRSVRAAACRQTSSRTAASPADRGSGSLCAFTNCRNSCLWSAAGSGGRGRGWEQSVLLFFKVDGGMHIILLLRENEILGVMKFTRLNCTLEVAELASGFEARYLKGTPVFNSPQRNIWAHKHSEESLCFIYHNSLKFSLSPSDFLLFFICLFCSNMLLSKLPRKILLQSNVNHLFQANVLEKSFLRLARGSGLS